MSQGLDAEMPTAADPKRIRRAALWALGSLALAAGIVIPAWKLAFSQHPALTPPPAPIQADDKGISLTENAPQWRYVELAVAKEDSLLAPLPAPGRVGFDELRTAAVGTPLAGRIDRLLVRLGDRVEKGERLFSVRSGAWADLEKEVQAATAAVGVKERLAQRAKELVSLQAAPEKDQLAAEAELHDAQLALQAAQAKRDSLRIAPEANNLFWVVAPRKGTVVEQDLAANQEATPDREKPLLRISDLDEVLVLADVQESDAGDIHKGSSVEARTSSGLTRAGEVEQVSEVVDPTRRTVEVRVRVANKDRALRPNAYAEISFSPAEGAKRVRVPSEAVVTDGANSVVFVAQGSGRLERVPVTVGRQRDGEVELLRGLSPGSRYVSRGALLLLNQIELARR